MQLSRRESLECVLLLHCVAARLSRAVTPAKEPTNKHPQKGILRGVTPLSGVQRQSLWRGAGAAPLPKFMQRSESCDMII